MSATVPLAAACAAGFSWCVTARSWPARRLRTLGAGSPAVRRGEREQVVTVLTRLADPLARGPFGLPVLPLGLAPLAAMTAGPVAAVVVAILAAVVVQRRRAAVRDAADGAERAGAVEACSALAAELRAGRAVGPAFGVAAQVATGPCGEALRRASASVALGGDVPVALALPGEAAAAVVLRRLAACWLVSARSGAGLAAAVDELADGLRAQERQRRELASQLAGPRATASLLAALPVIGIAFGSALGAAPLQFLLHRPAGLACLGAGLLLELAGLAWTDQMVASARRVLP